MCRLSGSRSCCLLRPSPAALSCLPESRISSRGPTRSVGARVILVNGFLAGYLRRGERELLLFLPETEPQRSQFLGEVARTLFHLAVAREESRRGMLLAEINGEAAVRHPASRVFVEQGFTPTAMGLQARLPFGYAQGTRSDGRGVGPRAGGHGPAGGIGIAGVRTGGIPMAEQPRGDDLVDNPPSDETSETEQDRGRSSNEHDQAMERAGESAPHNRGHDSGANVEDVDPDSANSDVDRDDTLTD